MEAKLKVITIGDYKDSILKKSFKDNENIEFLELTLDESIKNFNTDFSKKDIIFLITNAENLEKLVFKFSILSSKSNFKNSIFSLSLK